MSFYSFYLTVAYLFTRRRKDAVKMENSFGKTSVSLYPYYLNVEYFFTRRRYEDGKLYWERLSERIFVLFNREVFFHAKTQRRGEDGELYWESFGELISGFNLGVFVHAKTERRWGTFLGKLQ